MLKYCFLICKELRDFLPDRNLFTDVYYNHVNRVILANTLKNETVKCFLS